MTSMTMELEGAEKLAVALDKLTKAAEVHVSRALSATGLELRGDIVKRYNKGPATGVVYDLSSPNRTHRASAPGEAPMTDTGRLASSVTFKEVPAKLAVEVESKIDYAAHLEFGTRRMAARPAWVPAIEDMAPKFRKRIEGALRKATQ